MLGVRCSGNRSCGGGVYYMQKPDVDRFFHDMINWPHKFQAAVLVNGTLAFPSVTLSINRWGCACGAWPPAAAA
jgi:hypothetical protein